MIDEGRAADRTPSAAVEPLFSGRKRVRARYDFTGSTPLAGSFPYEQWLSITRNVLESRSDARLLAPAPAQGMVEVRRAIAGHLREHRGMLVSADQVVIGAGAQSLYSIIARLLGRDGSMALEDPGYGRLEKIYRFEGIETVRVRIDEEGMIPRELERSGARMIHVLPSHQVPTGLVTSLQRRYDLLAWAAADARRYIVEDDYESEFVHEGRAVSAMRALDATERVIYVNTFSRTIAPGVRAGYLVLPPHLAVRFAAELGFHSNSVPNLEQLVLAEFIGSGEFAHHVARMRRKYRATLEAALSTLERMGLSSGVRGCQTGLHFTLDLPSDLARTVRETHRERGCAVRFLDSYWSRGTQGSSTLVIGYAGMSPDEVPEALGVLLAPGLRSREGL